ncbi:MAG: acyltransferase [Bacillota bacterium]
MRKRIAELDILRAVAAFAVVMIHVTAAPLTTLPIQARSFFWYSLVNQWSRFSIPAFVLITGLVLFYSYGRREEFRAGEFFTRRLQSVAVPYLVWTLLYMLWRTRIESTWGQFPTNLGWAVLRGTAMYQLYFIVLIFQYYLLFPLIRPLGRSRWLGAAVAASLALQALLMWDTYYGLFTPQITAPWAVELFKWRDRLFPWWIGYFMVGVYLAARLDALLALARRWAWPMLAAAGGLLTWMMVEYAQALARPGVTVGFAATGFRPSAYVYSLVAIVGLVGLGGWLQEREGWWNRALLEMGKHSFGIFLVHPLVLELTTRLLRPLLLTPSVHLVVVGALVLAGSYLFSRAVAALPFGHWIVGRA